MKHELREIAPWIAALVILLWAFLGANAPFWIGNRVSTALPVPRGPDDTDVLIQRAQEALQRNDLHVANTLATRAVRRQPSFSRAHEVLGMALERRGDLVPALMSYSRAVQLHPRPRQASRDVMRVSRALTKDAASLQLNGRTEQAIDLYNAIIRHNPRFAPAYFAMGSISFQREEFQMAEEYLQMAVKQDPHLAEAHELLGTLYERTGEFPRSRYHFRRSTQMREKSKKDKDDAGSEDS